jgi:hypothetical protein
MKAIWFRAGLLANGRRPLDLPDVADAVDSLEMAYENVDKDYVWPTLLQALTAIGGMTTRDPKVMGKLIDLMGGDPADQDELRKAVGKPTQLRDAIKTIGASQLAYTDDCDVVDVLVDGVPAVFLYTGFTTEVPFAKLSGWLDPNEWHVRAPVLFRSVSSFGKETKNKWRSYDLWHQTFTEDATPFPNNTVVRNMLGCDNAATKNGPFSITSYDLDGRDNDVLVDCGYQVIRDLGDVRAAGFVKMIGFKDPAQNEMINELRHMWVSLIRTVAEGDATSYSRGNASLGDPSTAGDGQTSVNQLVQGWIDASTSCLQASGSFAGNMIGGFTGARFGWDDFRRTVTGYWSDIAQHYVSAWSATQGAVAQMNRPDGAATRASVMMGPGTATSWVPIEPSGRVGETIQFDEMRSIADTRVVVPPSRIAGEVVADGDERLIVVRVNAQGLRRGVYVGTARLASSGNEVPTFVYVTGATVKAA